MTFVCSVVPWRQGRTSLQANGIFAVVFADDAGRQEMNLQFAQGTKLIVKPKDEERIGRTAAMAMTAAAIPA